MPLYQIQDDDRPGFVVADSLEHALKRYNEAVARENDGDEGPPPKGIIYLTDDTELILNDEGWLK